MFKISRSISLIVFALLIHNVYSQSVTVKNQSNVLLKDFMVEIPVNKLPLTIGNYYVVSKEGVQLPVEIVSDINAEQIAVFSIERLQPNAILKFNFYRGQAENYPKRTYAEIAHKIGGQFVNGKYQGEFSWVKPNFIRLPGNFKDHSYFIKYEGAGWESDKVAYRFYLDQRNALDAFGKKTPGIVLPAVGVDGYDNYHKMAVWGMDDMEVGKSLGIGSIAYWDGKKAFRVEKRDSLVCCVISDGKVRSQIKTVYYGWEAANKVNLTSLITIDAGHRASHMELKIDGKLDNIATGIIKLKNTEIIVPPANDGEWTYYATFGCQSMNNDNMGLAIFYRKRQLQTLTEDELNHVIVLTPDHGYVEYYFMATWEKEWQPIQDKASFINAIDDELNCLNQKVSISINKK
ncbi:MAG TPA: DUF4861 family protein [Paludibacteraceae bacterium]|nr:DUF4861 family protein [Paludibacteraceae bacterium]